MDLDDPVLVKFGDREVGIGVIASEPIAGKVQVKMDGNELFDISAPADWFTPTNAGGHVLQLPPKTRQGIQ